MDDVEAESNFPSVQGNVCVYKGRWMYEVTLGSIGVQQHGWFTDACRFTDEEGVGDSPNSYAYDGNRVKRWSASRANYGQPWSVSDVIGCCIDCDNREILFFRNGTPMGVAFSGIRTGPGVAYYPGISLSRAERAQLNFGAFPFRYPIEGFLPLQQPTPADATVQCKYLLGCFRKLVSLQVSGVVGVDEAVIMGAHISEFLSPFIDTPSIVAEVVYPLVLEYITTQQLAQYFALAAVVFAEHEFRGLVHQLVAYVTFRARTTLLAAMKVEGPAGMSCLVPYRAAHCLLACPEIADVVRTDTQAPLWIEGLLALKQQNSLDLQSLLPVVWWPNTKEAVCSQAKMEEHLSVLQGTLGALWDVQQRIAQVLLEEGMYLPWLQTLLAKDVQYDRAVTPAGLTEISILVNFFFITVALVADFIALSHDQLPLTVFYDQTTPDMPRVGGLYGSLLKETPPPPEHATAAAPAEARRALSLVQCVVALYHIAMTRRFKHVAKNTHAQATVIQRLNTANERERARASGALRSSSPPLSGTVMLRDEAVDLVRLCQFHKQILFGKARQEALHKVMCFSVRILLRACTQDPLFSYLPEWYVEAAIDSFHALRKMDPPYPLLSEEHRPSTEELISFLCKHFADTRIKHPDTKDLLLQSLTLLILHPEYRGVFDRNPAANESLLPNLIPLFDQQFWVPATKIIFRLWKGKGFAQSSTEEGLPNIQASLARCAQQDGVTFSTFLNKVFNNLNGTLSELGVAMNEEKQQIQARRPPPDVENTQRKVAVLFELSVALARILEIISTEVPETFVCNELNMARLCELVLFVLTRTTVGTDSSYFHDVCDIHRSTPLPLNAAFLLSPVVGLCCRLHEYAGRRQQQQRFATVLASATGFTVEPFEFLARFDWAQALRSYIENPALMDLATFAQFVTELRLSNERMAAEAAQAEQKGGEDSEMSEDDLCSICCVAPIDTRFTPCGHTSCHRCIQRHLLNNTTCFFCKAPVLAMERLSVQDTNNPQ
eukprot:TRINITY_DN8041_c0_g1_i1.p1 TRINITY_DN8041_c0_g1~~TRINITY_DN8041_c0_g1_i1.p1  ORF type:complete len:1095 (+),score=263.00 TRINITY_DN8041_c0_g1_i1:275-3286(+)